MKTRLGTRLRALFDAIPPGYDSVWDLGCDHGRLGMAVLESGRAPAVTFVDRLARITDPLQHRLTAYSAHGYRVLTEDARDLMLPDTGRHLLVLAGVGDELMVAILEALAGQAVAERFDWLLSPANNDFEVRNYLRRAGYGLLAEGLVIERGRGYEWLRLSRDRQRAPRPVPNPAGFWDARRADHRALLERRVRHGERQLKGRDDATLRARLAAYHQLLADVPE